MVYGKEDCWKGAGRVLKKTDEERVREERRVGGMSIYSEVKADEVVFKEQFVRLTKV